MAVDTSSLLKDTRWTWSVVALHAASYSAGLYLPGVLGGSCIGAFSYTSYNYTGYDTIKFSIDFC